MTLSGHQYVLVHAELPDVGAADAIAEQPRHICHLAVLAVLAATAPGFGANVLAKLVAVAGQAVLRAPDQLVGGLDDLARVDLLVGREAVLKRDLAPELLIGHLRKVGCRHPQREAADGRPVRRPPQLFQLGDVVPGAFGLVRVRPAGDPNPRSGIHDSCGVIITFL